MDVGAVQTLVANLGFPIACVIAMFWMLNKERESHKDEMAEITKAVENNTIALTKLVERIDNEK